MKLNGKALRTKSFLNLLHSERPKLYTILAFLSAIGLTLFPSYKPELHILNRVKSSLKLEKQGREATRNLKPTALRKAKIVYKFGLSECKRVKVVSLLKC